MTLFISHTSADRFADASVIPAPTPGRTPPTTPAAASKLALLLWDAYIAEGEAFELDQASGLLGRALAKFDGWTRRGGGHWREDIEYRWHQDRALLAELRQRLATEPRLNIIVALRALSEERWEFQNRARQLLSEMRQSDSSGSYLLAHALRFASEEGKDAALGAQLLEDAERAEGRDQADRTPLAVYELLLRAADPGLRERARQKIREQGEGRAFSTIAWQALRNFGTDDLAGMAVMGGAARLGTLARLATLRRLGPVAPGWRAVALGHAAEWSAEGGALWAGNGLHAALLHDCDKVFSREYLGESLAATVLSLSGLKVFRAAGQTLASPLIRAVESRLRQMAPAHAASLALAVRASLGHAIGLSGMIALTQLETAAGWREGARGGLREAATEDAVIYLKYGLAPRLFGPRSIEAQRRRLEEIRRREAETLERASRPVAGGPLRNPALALAFLFTGASGFGWFGKNGGTPDSQAEGPPSARGPFSSLHEGLEAIVRRLRRSRPSIETTEPTLGEEAVAVPEGEAVPDSEPSRETRLPGEIEAVMRDPSSLALELPRLGEISATQLEAARSYLKALRSSGQNPDPLHLANSLGKVLEVGGADTDLIETLLALGVRHSAAMTTLEEMRGRNPVAARLLSEAAGRGDINAIVLHAGCADQVAAVRGGDLDALYELRAVLEGKPHQIPILFGLYQEFYAEARRLGREASPDHRASQMHLALSAALKSADPGPWIAEGGDRFGPLEDRAKILESLLKLGNRGAEAALREEFSKRVGNNASLKELEHRALSRERGAVEAIAALAVRDPEAVFVLDALAAAHRRGARNIVEYLYPDSALYLDSILQAMEELDISGLTDLARAGSPRAEAALELLAERGNDHAVFRKKLRSGSSRPPKP